MYKYYDNKLKRSVINLAPGEYYATGEDIVISTVLGSCVAVAIYDPVCKISGLNHFMLAESKHKDHSDGVFRIERYGLYAMEAVINELMKLGGNRKRFQAKIFGGSRILQTKEPLDIGAENIEFAEKYLEVEKIRVFKRDTGGERARRIYLFPQTFRVLLRRIYPNTELDMQIKTYQEKIRKDLEDRGKAVIF